MIKSLSLIMVIMAFASLGFAQGTGYNGKQPSKEQKKLAKEADKAAKNQAEEQRRSISVEFAQLTRFPSSYLGSHRLHRIGVEDVQPYTDTGVTYYLLAVTDGNDTTRMVPIWDQVTFVFGDEEMAKQFVAAKQADLYLRTRTPVTDIYFDLSQKDVAGRRYFFAKVTCLALMDGFSGLIKTPIGNCNLVR
jgi:hypothetical protein